MEKRRPESRFQPHINDEVAVHTPMSQALWGSIQDGWGLLATSLASGSVRDFVSKKEPGDSDRAGHLMSCAHSTHTHIYLKMYKAKIKMF